MQRTYKAIFFDLDGTLIPMDTQEFLDAYMRQIAIFLGSKGFEDPKSIVGAIMKATMKVGVANEGRNNDVVFWEHFCAMTGLVRDEFEPFMIEFYEGIYNEIGNGLEQCDTSAAVLAALKEKGYPLYLTTMPLFPYVAVAERLKWVGLDASLFEHITTYDNSGAIKPDLDYYRAVIELAGIDPADILMVGNHTKEDLVVMELGCDTYLVTDNLINKNDFDIETVKHGTRADLLRFVEELPACGVSA